jgi:hypothetical protein
MSRNKNRRKVRNSKNKEGQERTTAVHKESNKTTLKKERKVQQKYSKEGWYVEEIKYSTNKLDLETVNEPQQPRLTFLLLQKELDTQ